LDGGAFFRPRDRQQATVAGWLNLICEKKRMPLTEAPDNNRGGILQEPLLLRSFLDTFAESACLLGETADVQGMNAAAERLLGYNEDELLGGSYAGFWVTA
jgi:PAS domain-containing protein